MPPSRVSSTGVPLSRCHWRRAAPSQINRFKATDKSFRALPMGRICSLGGENVHMKISPAVVSRRVKLSAQIFKNPPSLGVNFSTAL